MAYVRIKCLKCDETFAQESRFLDHLTESHEIKDHLQYYVQVYFEGKHPTCNCDERCQEKLSWSGWKKGFSSRYVRGHNAKIDSIYLNADKQAEFAKKRSEGYKQGKYSVWNSGLTKESSEKIAKTSFKISSTLKLAYKNGEITDWRTLNPEKAIEVSKKVSETKKRLYAIGELIPWNLGLTKDVNNSLLKSSVSIKENYQNNPRASAKRLTSEEVKNRVDETGIFELLSSPDDYKNKYQKLRLRCKVCQSIQLKNMMMIESTPVCHICHPKESKGHLEVLEFARSLGVENIISNDRRIISPLELDILIPENKLAIEYNGLYWHSTARILDKDYHEKKRIATVNAGYRFFAIYEDEWRDKKDIIMGMIRHRLGKCTEKYDARSLKVEEIDSNSSSAFFEKSHLEGSTKNIKTFGLVDGKGKIFAATSLRRPFHSSKSSRLEIARSAALPGISLRGWLGKLTKESLKYSKSMKYQGLMTYVDSRVGCGEGYTTSGLWMLEKSSTGPRFWWTDFENRFNRFKYKADKENGLTQAEVAINAGVSEIWGCSNSLLISV